MGYLEIYRDEGYKLRCGYFLVVGDIKIEVCYFRYYKEYRLLIRWIYV